MEGYISNYSPKVIQHNIWIFKRKYGQSKS
jgi:hypothetical protein